MDSESKEIAALMRQASQEKSDESTLACLKELTAKFRDDSFRRVISREDLLLLVDVFKGYSEQVTSKETRSLELCTECVRCLRNACVQCAKNQDAVASTALIESFEKLMRFSLDKGVTTVPELVLLRCCIQCLNNVASGHAIGQALVWNYILRPLMSSLFVVEDSKVGQYACMLLQTCLLNPECEADFAEDPAVPGVMDLILDLCTQESECDFTLHLLQSMLRAPNVIPQVFEKLTLSSQITLLDIANTCVTDEAEEHHGSDNPRSPHQKLSMETLKCFADKFANMGHHILSLAMRDSGSDQTPQLVTSLLDLLCTASATDPLRTTVQAMDKVLKSSLELLDMVEQVGRSSDNLFTVSHDFEASSREGEEEQQGPGYGFKRSLVQLVGNMCFRNRTNQDMVRELNGIPTILQQCNIDSKNAFINQWAILAIRNLCENNAENQTFIASLKNQGVADNETLTKLGFEAVQRDDGQVYLKNIKNK